MNASATTTTATANAISTAALSAYLKPLLKKHELGQLLILDDLMQAWDDAVIHCGENASIQKQLQTLHESQLKEYTLAAQQALTEYAQTVKLPRMEDTDTEQLYIDSCLAALQIPDWKLPDAPSRVLDIVRQRAITSWQKQGNDMKNNSNSNDDINSIKHEETAVMTNTTTTIMTTKPQKKTLLGVNKKSTPKKKITATKHVIGSTVPTAITAVAAAAAAATTTAKPAIRGGGRKVGGARGRRGGRGSTAGNA